MKVVKSLFVMIVAASAAVAAEAADCRLAAGWEQDGASRTFVADNLFEYLDGDAEGYLIYGFVRLKNVTCTKGEDSIVLDISEMADADAAYGIFAAHSDPNQPVAPIGMGGQILPRRASFAKGKFYVELAAERGEDYRRTLQAFVVELEKRIEGRSAPPEALAWFPTEGLTSVRLVPQSVLGLRPLKRGYVGEYATGKAFLVAEASAESAAVVLATLRQQFAGATAASVADEAFQAIDRYLGGLCIFRKGKYLGGFANTSEPQEAANLASTLAARLP
jgi:hypothetical protein